MLITLRSLLILGFSLSAVAHMAHADPQKKLISGEARRHLKQGNKLYNIRSFDQAIEEYKAGALIEEAPLFDYNLGQCFRQLGKYHEAIWHYERFINSGYPQGDLVDAANEFLAQMKSELAKKAMIEKPTDPAGAPPDLRQLQEPPSQLQKSPSKSTPLANATASPPGSKSWDRIGWGLISVGVAGAGVTTWLAISGAGFDSDATNETRAPASTRLSLQHQADSRRRAAFIVGIGSSTMLTLGIVKLAILSGEVPRRPAGAAWNLGITGDGVTVFGRF